MKKIMFNDKYGLTAAVLNRRKTMTRRTESLSLLDGLSEDDFWFGLVDGKMQVQLYDDHQGACIIKPRYNIGEIVAVAQNYQDVYEELKRTHGSSSRVVREFFHKYVQGGRMPVSNKMFVKPDLMPHRIRITDIKVERLKDISEADCLREGIIDKITPVLYPCGNHVYTFEGNNGGSWYGSIQGYITAKTAFAALIDKVSGSGTWERNPWVFAYTFELERRAR